MQAIIDKSGELFVTTVARNHQMIAAATRTTEADTSPATKATQWSSA